MHDIIKRFFTVDKRIVNLVANRAPIFTSVRPFFFLPFSVSAGGHHQAVAAAGDQQLRVPHAHQHAGGPHVQRSQPVSRLGGCHPWSLHSFTSGCCHSWSLCSFFIFRALELHSFTSDCCHSWSMCSFSPSRAHGTTFFYLRLCCHSWSRHCMFFLSI